MRMIRLSLNHHRMMVSNFRSLAVLLCVAAKVIAAFQPSNCRYMATTTPPAPQLRPSPARTTTSTCCLDSTDGGIHHDVSETRRSLLASMAILVGISTGSLSILPQLAIASDQGEDATANDTSLTTRLFNPDGSLRDTSTQVDAKFRSVDFSWEGSDTASHVLNVDGVNQGKTTGSRVQLSYKLPDKWGSGDELYIDLTDGERRAKACKRIIVYQAPGKVGIDRLEKAANLGIAKALDVTSDLQSLQSADLIGGRKTSKGDNNNDNDDNHQRYYEFEMAVAPETCGASKENLGLGFCPYDTIYLLSATVLEDHLYVLAIECDKDEWKRSNSDLKQVRSSFSVQLA